MYLSNQDVSRHEHTMRQYEHLRHYSLFIWLITLSTQRPCRSRSTSSSFVFWFPWALRTKNGAWRHFQSLIRSELWLAGMIWSCILSRFWWAFMSPYILSVLLTTVTSVDYSYRLIESPVMTKRLLWDLMAVQVDLSLEIQRGTHAEIVLARIRAYLLWWWLRPVCRKSFGNKTLGLKSSCLAMLMRWP